MTSPHQLAHRHLTLKLNIMEKVIRQLNTCPAGNGLNHPACSSMYAQLCISQLQTTMHLQCDTHKAFIH